MKKTITQKIITLNELETWQAGFDFAKNLNTGTTLALYGNLGAGKTKFLQGLAKGLGVKDIVNSPTFNILKTYSVGGNKTIKRFCHIDAYRLDSEKDLITLGIDEFISDPGTVTAIEWAEKIKNIWPENTLEIKLKVLTEIKRELIIKKQL
jgi:tRNA threonylcarbamoyladenosine biosynthesis protein TsaE